MLRKTICTAIAAAMAVCAFAQNYDVLDEVKADWGKSSGMEGPYRFENNVLTPAPKGYKPFYVSHYGRHGSRYAWSTRTYTLILDALTQAREADNLTPYGEEFLTRYEQFYKLPLLNMGDLVELGTKQHARIAEEMYKAFPEVFRGSRSVVARSSTAQRCILSMASFTTSLAKMNPRLEFSLSSTHEGMKDIVPPSAPEELVRRFSGMDMGGLSLEGTGEFSRRIVDYDGILARLFKDSSFIDGMKGGKPAFMAEYYLLLGGYQNYADVSLFQDAVTPEQYAGMWEASNYSSFTYDLQSRYNVIPLLEDIVERANAVISDGGPAADLRFGHDYIVEAFCCLLNLNSCGTVPQAADEVKYWFQSYNITMASTLQFVFYRSRKADDILFKVLWNGKEAVLPDLQAVSGPYYRWNDFKEFTSAIIAAHPELK